MKVYASLIAFISAATIMSVDVSKVHAQPAPAAETQQAGQNVVTIKPGDTLSKLGKAHGTSYKRLFDANTYIEHPDVIYSGKQVRIPAPDEQLASRPLPQEAPAAPVKPAEPAHARPATPKRTTRATAPTANVNGGIWDKLAQCEASGNWSANTGNGYYGGLQFSLSSWRTVGGTGYPHEASKSEQIARAEALKARQGWGAWPACSAKLGLR